MAVTLGVKMDVGWFADPAQTNTIAEHAAHGPSGPGGWWTADGRTATQFDLQIKHTNLGPIRPVGPHHGLGLHSSGPHAACEAPSWAIWGPIMAWAPLVGPKPAGGRRNRCTLDDHSIYAVLIRIRFWSLMLTGGRISRVTGTGNSIK